MDKYGLKTVAQRLNVYDEFIIKKAEEYLRLYQSKAAVKTLRDQILTVLAVDLAAKTLGRNFDKEAALALCGLKTFAYSNSLNVFEKVLGIEATMSVSNLCVVMGCTAVKDVAEDILEKYERLHNVVKDLEHPQYAAVATYLACKLKRVPVDRAKLISVSRLKAGQWKELTAALEKLVITSKVKEESESTQLDNNQETDTDAGVFQDTTQHQDLEQETEDYDVWRERTLREARAAIALMNESMDIDSDENGTKEYVH